MELPDCQYRSASDDPAHVVCAAPCVVVKNPIPAAVCLRCPIHQECDRVTEKPARGGQPAKSNQPGFGDMVGKALSFVGITDDRVSAWIGEPCNCAERREKLNALGRWAAGATAAGAEKARGWLQGLLGGEKPDDSGG